VANALSLALEIFGLATVVALGCSFILTWLGRKLTPAAHSGYFIPPGAVALGFFAGYAMLPRDWAPFIPGQNQPWQWLPYAGLVAAILASSFAPEAKSQAWKFAIIPAAAITAIYLTPSWPVFGLGPEKLRWVLLVYLLLIGVPLQHLPARLLNRSFAALLAVVAAITAIATGAMVSSRLAQLAAIAAGALAGTCVAGSFGAKSSDAPLRSLIPVFSILVGGIAWIACVEPDPPQTITLGLPLIPLAVCLVPSISRMKSHLSSSLCCDRSSKRY